MTFFVTGVAGFIGSHFAELCLREGHAVIGYDILTYAGLLSNVPQGVTFVKGDICDGKRVRALLRKYKPDAIFNFAAESHVCRSIEEASSFIHSNVYGTYFLLREALTYWRERGQPRDFRYIQISTDEVFGDLGPNDPPFTEESPHLPHSPYSASKSSADAFVRAFSHTYGLPTVTTQCSNNYGARQFPEKLIPLAVSRFLSGQPFVIHGTGNNVRDWITVEDHCRGILAAWRSGNAGQSYCFGGAAERTNTEVIQAILQTLGFGEITYGPDRPGNDRRYAINFSKAARELSWQPKDTFESALARTVRWYADNRTWIETMLKRAA